LPQLDFPVQESFGLTPPTSDTANDSELFGNLILVQHGQKQVLNSEFNHEPRHQELGGRSRSRSGG